MGIMHKGQGDATPDRSTFPCIELLTGIQYVQNSYYRLQIRKQRNMAKVITSSEAFSHSSIASTHSAKMVYILRLVLGSTVLCGIIIFLLGVSWDVQWHTLIGRDRTLIPPHIMLLSGLTLSGFAALAAVLVETAWTRREPTLVQINTSFAGFFHSSFGSYIAGYAVLISAIAFPLDSYWHSLYGIDVAIWAPFHIMIIGGGGIVPLGAAYMLISAAQLATRAGDRRATRAAYIAAMIAFATMLSIYTILLSDAVNSQSNTQGYVMIGTVMNGWNMFSLFPLLSGLLIAWTLIAAVYAIPLRRVASSIILVYLCFALLFSIFVPPATNFLLGLEHLSYRADFTVTLITTSISLSKLSLIAVRFWLLAPILVALLMNLFVGLAQRRGWSRRKLTLALALVALIACLPVTITSPFLIMGMIVDLGMTGNFTLLGVDGFLISLLLGVFGTFTGAWFGRHMGESMQQREGWS